MARHDEDPLGRGMRASYGRMVRLLVRRCVDHLSVPADIIKSIRDSGEENISVYVLPASSTVDYLLLSFLCEKYGWPRAAFVTDVPFFAFQSVRKGLFAGLRHAFAMQKSPAAALHQERLLLQDNLAAGRPVCLFLKKTGLFRRPDRWHILLWEQLLAAQKRDAREIRVIPVEFLWGRSPGQVQPSPLNAFLHDLGPPTLAKKLFLLLRAPGRVEARVGKPVSLPAFLASVPENKPEIQAKKLRRMLASHLYRERRVLTGPPIRRRDKVIARVLKDPRLQKTVEEHAHRKKIPEAEVLARVRRLLQEMVSDYRPGYVAVAYRAVRWIQGRLYRGIDLDRASLERIKTVAKDHSILYLPCHRSHMDYILLSKLFYEEGLIPPHIAAGVNLSFFPMGHIFRSTGAFFIRRKFAGDVVYARTLASYIRWLIRAGHAQEFFLEGGRTRTGKLQPPKVGLLSSEIEACLEQKTKDLVLIPVAVTYDRVPEESEYRSESLGSEKTRESWLGLLRAKKFLRRKHGDIAIRFADPISVFGYFRAEHAAGEAPAKDRIHALARDVIRALGDHTALTGTSLIATCLLAGDGADKARVRADALVLSDLFARAGAPLGREIPGIAADPRAILAFFRDARWLRRDGAGTSPAIDPKHRLVLDFHKNISLHFLVPAIAEAFGDDGAADEIRDILRHEFPYAPTTAPAAPPSSRELLRGVARNYLEGYWIAATALARGALTPKDLQEEGGRLATQAQRPAFLRHPEAASRFLLASAREFLLAREKTESGATARIGAALEKTLRAMPPRA